MAVDMYYKELQAGKAGLRLINWAINPVAADPLAADIVAGLVWTNTTDKRIKFSDDGVVVHTLAHLDDLNKLGKLQGGYDASANVLPATLTLPVRSAPAGTAIEAGDYWRVTVAGPFPGMASGSENLAVGDVIIALVDAPTDGTGFMSVEVNADIDAAIITSYASSALPDLVADTPAVNDLQALMAAITPGSNVGSFMVMMGTEEITQRISARLDTATNVLTLESAVALTGLSVRVVFDPSN